MVIRPHILCAVTCLAGGSAGLWAEETADLPPLVVTALRGSVLPEHFSGNATVIDEKAVAESGCRSLGELLEARGGLRITSTTGDPARGSISLRGFGENAASRTLILVDGKAVNRPDMAAANLQEIPVARIARVEILRGSQTARFGDNAVGGVVNIVTKQPAGKSAFGVETAGGSDGWRMVRASQAMDRDGQRLTLDGEFNRAAGWRDNSRTEADSLAAGWSHRLSPLLELDGGLSWGRERGRFPGPLTTAQYDANPRQSVYSGPNAYQYGSTQDTVSANLGATLETGAAGTLSLPVSWLGRDLKWNMGPGSHTDNMLQTLAVSPTLRQSGNGWNTEQGLSLRNDWLDITQYREMARLRVAGHADLTRTVLGAFATGECEPWRDWHFNAAFRATWASLDASARNVRRPKDPLLNFNRTASENHTAFQLGSRWEPTPDAAVWLRYDRLYRLPSVDEIAAYQGFPLSQPFNDRLEAETGHNFELGGEWNPGPWEFRANVFAQFLEGEIAYDYVRNLNVNLADTRRYGGEVEAAYRAEKWSASVRYAGVDARYESGRYDGKTIYLVPNHHVVSRVEVSPWKPLTISLEHQWQSSCFEGNDFSNKAPKLPAFQVFNLGVRYQASATLACYARVANLFDEHYATLKYSGAWYPAAGRQFQFGIRYVF